MNLSVALRDKKTVDPAASPESISATIFSRSRSLWTITYFWFAIYFAGMFTPALLDDVDSIHAEAAREMLVRHDWVTLYTNGIRYLEKAPLMYWSLATSYSIFGISDWSTRLPLMLGVLGLLLATYQLGRYAFGESGGLYAGVVLATSVGPYIFTRFLIPDVLVGLWLTIGYYFFLRSLDEEPPSRLTCWGFAATCALNVLTKGLIGLVFPAGAIGLYLLLTGNLRHLLKLRIFSSTLVFLGIAAPWHILASVSNPSQGAVRGFVWFYFINEHLMRFMNRRVPRGYDTIPALPGMALLVGGWVARESGPAASESDRRAGRISSTVLMVFGVLAFTAGMYLLSVSHLPTAGADLADLLKKNPQDYDFSLGHVLDLTPRALGAFRGPLLGASLGLLLGTGFNWILRRRDHPVAGNVALAVMMVGLLACVHSSFSTFSPVLSSYKLAVAIRKQFRAGDVIVIDGQYHQAANLNFYTGVQVHVLHEPSGNLWYGAKFPDAPHIFETPESLAVLWNGPSEVFLWTDQDNPKELRGFTSFLLARSGGKSVYSNRPQGD